MRKRPRPDQIAAILRDFQADLDAGLNINHACRKAGIGPTTYYRWKALQEDPISDEQLRISELESEVGRLKLLVAELALDRRMLQEALKKTRVAKVAGEPLTAYNGRRNTSEEAFHAQTTTFTTTTATGPLSDPHPDSARLP